MPAAAVADSVVCMGSQITLTSSDGFVLDAYEARPAGTAKGGVVVIQEIFGVNSHIRSVADGYAEAGYYAVAPALFDRSEKNIELGYTQDDIQVGIGIARGKIDVAKALLDVTAAANRAAQAGKVGVVGYCWGGMLVAQCAVNLGGVVSACSSYYGGGIGGVVADAPKVPIILHFGEHDHAIPLTEVDSVRAAWPNAIVHVYEGAEHGFNCDQRASYNAASAALAKQRTLEFFGKHL